MHAEIVINHESGARVTLAEFLSRTNPLLMHPSTFEDILKMEALESLNDPLLRPNFENIPPEETVMYARVIQRNYESILAQNRELKEQLRTTQINSDQFMNECHRLKKEICRLQKQIVEDRDLISEITHLKMQVTRYREDLTMAKDAEKFTENFLNDLSAHVHQIYSILQNDDFDKEGARVVVLRYFLDNGFNPETSTFDMKPDAMQLRPPNDKI